MTKNKYKLAIVLCMHALFASGLSIITKAEALAQTPQELITTIISNAGLKGDFVKRLEAREKLVQIAQQNSSQVVSYIISELKQPHDYDNDILQQRIALIETLRDIGVAAEVAVPALTAIMQDQDKRLEWVHFVAGSALLAIGTPDAQKSSDMHNRHVLGEWRRNATPTDVAQAVKEHDFFIRQQLRMHELGDSIIEASVVALMMLGSEAKSALQTLLRAHADPRVGSELRRLIEKTLTGMGVPDVAKAVKERQPERNLLDEIIADLNDSNDLTFGLALNEFVHVATPEKAVNILIKLLSDGRSPGSIANSLLKIGKPAQRALPELLKHLDHRSEGAQVIQAIGVFGADSPKAIEALRAVVANPKSQHRGIAASMLGQMRAKEAVPELIDALSANEKYTRILAIKAIGVIGSPAGDIAVSPLILLLKDSDRDIQIAAANALSRFGSKAALATPVLTKLLSSSDMKLKVAARSALTNFENASASIALKKDAIRYKTSDRQEANRLLSVYPDDLSKVGSFLHKLPKERSLQLARYLLDNENTLLSYMACNVLIRAGHEEETLPTLAKIIASGKAETEMNSRFGYDWLHSDNSENFEKMFKLLSEYLEAHLQDYSAQEQARVRSYISPKVSLGN